MSPLTRRTVLKGAAATGLAAAAVPLVGNPAHAAATTPSTPAASTAPAATGTIADVQHVVFLMLENRSFDHVFGTLKGVRGFDDRSVTRPDGGNIFAQYDATSKRYELPFLLSQDNNGQNTPSLSHNWGPQHASLNGGANDNWVNAHRSADGDADGIFTMGYYSRTELPYHFALADAFTLCDNYFCSVLGPTYPNRLMWQTGSIDPNGTGGGPLLTTDESVFTNNTGQGVFSYETYPERLTKAGVSWKAYTDPASNHLLNMFPSFTQYNDPVDHPDLYAQGTVGGSTADFLADIDAGTLPQVSWIFPTAQSTEHPDDGTPNMGPQYYAPIISALMASPSWASTVLFVTYDENDGYFDHVPPPQAPVGTPMEYLTHDAYGKTATSDPSKGITGPVGLGFRVPTWVVSPWSVGGYTATERFDHTSGLRFVEKRFGVSLDGILSPWRRAMTGDMTSTLDFTTAVTDPAALLPYQQALQTAYARSQQLVESQGTETVPNPGAMPTQEPGTRPVRAAAGPGASLPEVGTPALLLGVGAAAAGAAAVLARKRLSQ